MAKISSLRVREKVLSVSSLTILSQHFPGPQVQRGEKISLAVNKKKLTQSGESAQVQSRHGSRLFGHVTQTLAIICTLATLFTSQLLGNVRISL